MAGKKEPAREYAEMAAHYRAEADAEIAQQETAEVSPSTELFEPEFSKPELSNASDSEPAAPSDLSAPAEPAFAGTPVEIDLSDEWDQVSVEDVSPCRSPGRRIRPEKLSKRFGFILQSRCCREAEFAIQHLSEVDPCNSELPALRRQLAAKRAAGDAGDGHAGCSGGGNRN